MFASIPARLDFVNFFNLNKCSFEMDAEWLSGRMPDSRAREHRHESSYGLHIGAGDGDSLWRCYAMTTQNHSTCYFVINHDLFIYYLSDNDIN